MTGSNELDDVINAIEPKAAEGVAPEAGAGTNGGDDIDIAIAAASAKPSEGAAPEFAGEQSRVINEMFSRGASVEEVQNYLRLSVIDTSAMDNESLVKEHLRFENPGLSQDDLQDLFDEEYGEGNAKAKAKLLKAAAKAKEVIGGLQSASTETQAQKRQLHEAQALEEARGKWGQVADAVIEKRMATVDIQDLGFSFGVPAESREFLKQAAIEFAVQNKLEMKKDSLPAIEDHLQRLVFYMHGQDIVDAALRDALTKGKITGLQQRVNPSTKHWTGGSGAPPDKDSQEFVNKIAKSPFG